MDTINHYYDNNDDKTGVNTSLAHCICKNQCEYHPHLPSRVYQKRRGRWHAKQQELIRYIRSIRYIRYIRYTCRMPKQLSPFQINAPSTWELAGRPSSVAGGGEMAGLAQIVGDRRTDASPFDREQLDCKPKQTDPGEP